MIVDLTLTISESLPSFPGSPAPQFLDWADLGRDGYNLEMVFMSTHSGTHIDAPSHFAKDGMTVDQIPVGRLTCDATLVRLPSGQGRLITREDIESFERKNGPIPEHGAVVFHTGWQRNIRRRDYFTGNPGLSESAARYLVSKKAGIVGTDSPSIDAGTDKRFTVHRILSRNDILIVENLANLRLIKKPRFSLTVLPLRLKGASGSPVRATATCQSR